MQYIAVLWHHQFPDEPVELFSELDSARWERRKVEVFADGRRGFASVHRCGEGTELGSMPVPPLAEIASAAEFTPREISREEFEAVWASTPGTA